jgi:VanZ family protein
MIYIPTVLLIFLPGVSLAVASLYLAFKTRLFGAYLMTTGGVLSVAATIAQNYIPQSKVSVFDAAGRSAGVYIETGKVGLWFAYAQVPSVLLTATGIVILARQWKTHENHVA